MTEFKRIALVRNEKVDPGDMLVRLADFLVQKDCTVLPEKSCAGALGDEIYPLYSFEQLHEADLAIVIGGDGTLLNAARNLAPYGVPIVGINMGRLGFLVDVSPDDLLGSMQEILQGNFISEHRLMLRAEVLREDKLIAEHLAFNDVVVNNQYQARMIEFNTHANDRYVNHERADGIVVATPTGSTAYALSSGGPILHPALEALALVPICPHTLNHRPLVIDASVTITVAIDPECTVEAQVSFDGQANCNLQAGDRVRIRRSETRVELLHPQGYEFYDILRAKLRWGKQPGRTPPR
ncbi:MAG: NAD(+) kinase [Gammaproteobacteria bacterium]|nr:NAD(+) kinase [Gammaproteobacteria bacterium]